VEIGALDQTPEAVDAMVLHGRPLLLGFIILKVDARERFADLKFARFPVEADAAPIIDAVGRVGTLLNFDQHDTRVDGMQAARGNKEGVARQNGEAVDAIFKCLRLVFMLRGSFQDAHEISPRNTAPQPGNEVRILLGFEQAPHLGFGFALQLRGDRRGRMHLQREPLAGIEQLDQQGKPGGLAAIGSQKLRSMGLNLLAQRLAFVRTLATTDWTSSRSLISQDSPMRLPKGLPCRSA